MKSKIVSLVLATALLMIVAIAYAQVTAFSEDAYVDLNDPNTNFNTASFEVASSSFGGTCTVTKRMYQKIDYANQTPVAPIGQSTFTYEVTNVLGDGTLEVWSADDTWTEGTITWNNAPAPIAMLNSWTKPAANGSTPLMAGAGALATYLETQRNGDGVATLVWQITGCTSFINTFVGDSNQGTTPPGVALADPTAVDMVDTNASNNNMALWAGIVVLFGLLTAGFVVVRKQGQTG